MVGKHCLGTVTPHTHQYRLIVIPKGSQQAVAAVFPTCPSISVDNTAGTGVPYLQNLALFDELELLDDEANENLVRVE